MQLALQFSRQSAWEPYMHSMHSMSRHCWFPYCKLDQVGYTADDMGCRANEAVEKARAEGVTMAEEARTAGMAPLRVEVRTTVLGCGAFDTHTAPQHAPSSGHPDACTHLCLPICHACPATGTCPGQAWKAFTGSTVRRQCLQVARLRESARDLQTQLSKDTADLRAAATQRENAARAEAQGAIEQLQATAAQLQVKLYSRSICVIQLQQPAWVSRRPEELLILCK